MKKTPRKANKHSSLASLGHQKTKGSRMSRARCEKSAEAFRYVGEHYGRALKRLSER